MTAKEFLQKVGIEKDSTQDICFVIGKTIVESEHQKEVYYRSSPVRCAYEWFDYLNHAAAPEKNILNYHVLNIQQPVVAWLSGVNWNPAIQSGQFISLLVMSDEELSKYYSEKQWRSSVKYIENRIEDILEDSAHLKMFSFMKKK